MRVLLACAALRPEPAGVPLAGLGIGAAAACQALARGWAQARPDDLLTLMPLPDGAPGSAQALDGPRVRSRSVLVAPGPLGEAREVDLIGLDPAPGLLPSGAQVDGPAPPCTWFLDAARLTALPEDRDVAAREALEGTSAGLGTVLADALARTRPGDTLVVGLSRSAVHDGGAGLLDGLGGATAARMLLDGRDVLLALADDVPLGGLGGAGQALSDVTALTPEQAQDLDRCACATASRLVTELARPREGSLTVLSGDLPEARTLTVSSWGTGAAGGSALVLRALGARAMPGARVMASLLGLGEEASTQDLLVTTQGEAYDVLAHSVPAVVGEAAVRDALPAVLVVGRGIVPRGELAEAGLVSLVALQPGSADAPWDEGGADGVSRRLEQVGGRLARTWSR